MTRNWLINFGHKPALNIQPFYRSSQLHYVGKEGLQEETRSFIISIELSTKTKKQTKNMKHNWLINFGRKPALHIQPFYRSSQLHYAAKEDSLFYHQYRTVHKNKQTNYKIQSFYKKFFQNKQTNKQCTEIIDF